MSKRKAIILFGGLLVLVLAYVGWCARPFYLKPEAEVTINPRVIPPDTRRSFDHVDRPKMEQALMDWYAESDVLGPPAFDWELLGKGLADPWENHAPKCALNVNEIYQVDNLARPNVTGFGRRSRGNPTAWFEAYAFGVRKGDGCIVIFHRVNGNVSVVEKRIGF